MLFKLAKYKRLSSTSLQLTADREYTVLWENTLRGEGIMVEDQLFNRGIV